MTNFLNRKIAAGKARIAVIGLGYVGLPLAVNFAKKGFQVFGLDKDTDRVANVNKKVSYILDIPSKELAEVVGNGRLRAETEFEVLKTADVIIICVPTPLKRKYTPDITYIVSAVRTIRRFLKKNMLIVLESTTYPGTTEELIKPELEKSGLKAEKDFFLAFSPERIDPGNPKYDVTRIPKIVGGLSAASGELTQLLYQKIIRQVHLVSSARAAEMTKLLENTFRIINIGWVNEVAMMCHKLGIDVWEIIEAAKTKPFGFMPFYPGLGVGGHCIPDDPLYLYWKAKHHGFSSKFIKLSADINSNMPRYVADCLAGILGKKKKRLSGARLLIVGVTYKKDVKDLRKSPPLKLIEILQGKGARVEYYDPIIPYLDIGGIRLSSIKLSETLLSRYDCIIIATDHTRVDYKDILKHGRLIYDIRNVYAGVRSNKVVKF
ncbi:MAG: UDP-N-acetyl-D-glucosamine dehydrogenase [Omnitrophica WOR_2 bacterium RIFCSPLOWO2_12_FULL_50_9]|nr:MAG: UDP-N-acetyl-D-glucosamine dehydrogenase [Omnitrophica WOR_2 bacterium RIFCSPHIGHO2_02_FULL_50_17]OGX41902.1 MAG: UDP-N-acetyl-D-glucosamine dehydrogenase [Omnitrophica WOR_2 bacterium RIFCSPLOWO2_12_FULL_50_9]